MKQGQAAVSWVVEARRARSAACLVPDTKGTMAKLVCEAGLKGQRTFAYTGLNIPDDAIRELGAKYPGLVVTNLAQPQPVNADVVFTDQPAWLGFCWHAPTLILMGPERGPPGSGLLCRYPNEPPVWIKPAGALPPRKFEVKTKNCVEDEVIQQNVLYSLGLGLPCLPQCSAHGLTAHVVSAGPSLVNQLVALKSESASDPASRVFCVKHSHDLLMDAGILPWACFLLDPRAHVKDFIETPGPGVKYFVSSTCNPATFDRLLSRQAEVWLYHALVGAGERALVTMHNQVRRQERQRQARLMAEVGLKLPPESPHSMVDHLVSGGTTSASRGISVLHMMGFRRFVLWGFDSCMWEKPDLGARKDDGQARFHELELGGRKWWTDAELYAQVQDFMHLAQALPDCTLEPRGDGMIPHLLRQQKKGMWDFNQVFSA